MFNVSKLFNVKTVTNLCRFFPLGIIQVFVNVFLLTQRGFVNAEVKHRWLHVPRAKYIPGVQTPIPNNKFDPAYRDV